MKDENSKKLYDEGEEWGTSVTKEDDGAEREHSEEPECMGGNELCKYLSLLFAIFNMVH